MNILKWMCSQEAANLGHFLLGVSSVFWSILAYRWYKER
jgi:hypothetical protein